MGEFSGKGNDVVISGIGGKFPGIDNVLQLQEKLFAKEDFITDNIRWVTDAAGVGKINDIHGFDASAFKMHNKLVRETDPTTTHTLEQAFEAFVDAGLNPFTMSGRNIAVISASMISDCEISRTGTVYKNSAFTIMGISRSMVANRISYTFNLKGPSYSIHTSWSGGANALEQGAKLIAQGFAEAAIVTTANLIFLKSLSHEYEKINFLTPGCRCRSFDAEANGTCRSEGVVSFFLQRASDAKRNYATVLSIHSDCLGLRSCSLIHFDKLLTESLREFYKKNNIDPEDIAYLEADGSGIKCFDAVELNAISSVFFEKRTRPLAIGSIKSNVGNTEASSSFLGIIKAIIAMETGIIPPNIHYTKPNSDIPSLVNGQLQVVTEATELKGDLVSINSLSIGGSLGHVVLQRNKKVKQTLAKGQLPPDGLPRLIMVSSRHEEGAKKNIEKLQSMPVDVEYVSLVNDVFKTNIPGYLWKSYVVVPSAEIKYNIKECNKVKQQPLWYVFAGVGSQWCRMGEDLLRIPVFSAAVDKCDAVLKPKGIDIRYILTTDDTSVFNNILNCFVGIAAVQIGLIDILRTVGLEPDGMVGHSVGELGCAYADGCFTAKEMILSAYARGKASLESETIQGMMASVGMGYKDISLCLPPTIDIACHNAADNCTLSGKTNDVKNYVQELKDLNIFAKAVSAGSIAYHSRYVQPIAPKLLSYMSELITEPKTRSAKWISSSVPEAKWSTVGAQFSSAEYHTNNLLNPVLFEEACRHIPDNSIVIEIAPHGLLQAILRRSLGPGCVNVSLTNRQAENGVVKLLEALGTLYLNNVSLDVNPLYPLVEYPVSNGTPYIAPLLTWNHQETWFQYFQDTLKMKQQCLEQDIELVDTAKDYDIWSNHCIEGQIVIPMSQILIYVWKLFCSYYSVEFEKETIIIEDVIMSKQVVFKPCRQVLEMMIGRGTNNFGALLIEDDVEKETVLTGRINQITKYDLDLPPQKEEEEDKDKDELEVSEAKVLSVLSQFGYQLGPQFQAVKYIYLKSKGFKAELKWTGNLVTFLDTVFKLFLFVKMDKEQQFLYPSSFQVLVVNPSEFLQLEKGTVIEVHYDSRSNILHCEGLLLMGLDVLPDNSLQRKDPSLQWKKRTYVPFNCDKLKLEDFISSSLQLLAEQGLNRWRHKVVEISLLEIKDNTNTQTLLSKILKNMVKSFPYIRLKTQVLELDQARDKLQFNSGECYLVTGSYSALQQIIGCVDTNVFLLAYVHRPQNPSDDSRLLKSVLVHHIEGGGQLQLLRKKSEVKHLKIMEIDSKQWLSDLAHLFNGSDNGHPVVVISRKWSPREILPILAKQKYAHQLRCVFLDKSAPEFSSSSYLYHNQLSLDLSVNLLALGVWSTDFTVDIELDHLDFHENTQGVITSSDTSLDVNIIALNSTIVTYDPNSSIQQMEMKYLDYCGTKADGNRVMGVSYFDSRTNTLIPDPLLSWQVPQQWSMEDAVSVPVAFTLAYYCLHVKARVKAGENVLVLGGSCPVSQACIAVALQAGAFVLVTIESKDQIAPLLQAFPQLKPCQVFSHNQRYKHLIQKNTKKLDVVINCLQDTHITSWGSLINYYSIYIHLGSIDIRKRDIVGMNLFIKNTNMIAITLKSLFNSDNETKKELQIHLRNGLKQNAIKPLRKRLFTLQNFLKAVNNLQTQKYEEKTLVVMKAANSSELPLISPLGFQCEQDKSYIIVGSGDLWLDLMEWLIQRGARKLLIAPIKDSMNSNFIHRFEQMFSLSYVKIVVSSASQLNSHTEAVDLLHEADTLGTVAAVFCVGLEENSPKITYLDSATRQVVPQLEYFVCLLSDGASVYESRTQLGLSTFLIQSESLLNKPQAVLPYLSSILTDNSSTGHEYLVSDKVSKNQDVGKETHSFLPLTVAELLALGEDVSLQPSLQEVVTRSPCYDIVKHNLLPVFILPGTHSAKLQPFIQNLMYPAYSMSLPESAKSVENTADLLLKEVFKVQPMGPYNLLGESWSGAVAFHLAILLERHGHQVVLFLLDAAPTTSQQCAMTIYNQEKCSLDIGLLTTLFNLDIKTTYKLESLNCWEEQLRVAVQLVEYPPEILTESVHSLERNLAKALTALRSHLTTLLEYKPQPQLFKGIVHLISQNCTSELTVNELQMYCEQRPITYLMDDENHEQMVRSHACATIVNENLLYSWEI